MRHREWNDHLSIMLFVQNQNLSCSAPKAAENHGEPCRKRGAFRCSIIGAALILNCPIAFAQHDQYSADFLMPDCREEAALIPFSNPSNEHSDPAHFCLGIIVGLSYLGRSDGTICVPVGITRQQAVGAVVQYIDGQPTRMNENFVPLAIEALQAAWPCKH
jgi:Rap1a immunity proteins